MPRHAVREPHFKTSPIITTSAFSSRPNFSFRNNFTSSIWCSCNTPDMPSEEPPCPCCNSTDTLVIPLLFTSLSHHICMFCRSSQISGPIDESPIFSGHLSAGDGDETRILDVHRSFSSPSKASALERGPSPLHQFLAMQATAAEASGSAEIKSAFNEPDGVPERRYIPVRRLPGGTYAAGIRFERNGPQVLLGTFGTAEEAAPAYDRAAYAPRDATAILNFPNEFPLGCKAASSEPQTVQNAMLLLNERARADDSLPGLYFGCKACGRTFPTHQAWEVHRLSHLELTPTKPNVSVNATTMPNRVSSGEFIGLAHQDSDDIEKGRLSDHVRGRPRWAIVVDPLFDVNVQGAFTLVAFKTSNGSSPAKDVLLYVLGFVYVLGFLSAVGGKLFRSFKMQLIGSAAAALGFLLTMALLLV